MVESYEGVSIENRLRQATQTSLPPSSFASLSWKTQQVQLRGVSDLDFACLVSGWWFQANTSEKICASQIGNPPQIGVNIKKIFETSFLVIMMLGKNIQNIFAQRFWCIYFFHESHSTIRKKSRTKQIQG